MLSHATFLLMWLRKLWLIEDEDGKIAGLMPFKITRLSSNESTWSYVTSKEGTLHAQAIIVQLG